MEPAQDYQKNLGGRRGGQAGRAWPGGTAGGRGGPGGLGAEAQREMFTDWIAAGLDPSRCTLFIQSHVKQHAELFLLLGMIAPIGWLERVPTYKELQEQLAEKELNNYGF